MSTDNPFSEAEWAAQVASERTRREQAETALAAAQARLAALEQAAVATARRVERHQQQLAALVENLRVGTVLVDEAGQIQYVNQYFCELFGIAPPPVLPGQPIPLAAVAIRHAFADPVAFSARARALHEAGQTRLGELFTLADGRVLELDYLVLDAQHAGRLICYRDVTERHQQAEALRIMAFIPEQNPHPVIRLAVSGEIIYTNPATDPDLLQLVAQGALQPLVQAAIRAAAPHEQELAVAGQFYLCTAVAIPGQPYVTLYLTNITARQQVKEELARQQAFYETILENVPTAVAVFDADYRYKFVNPAIEPDPGLRVWMMGRTMAKTRERRQLPRSLVQQREAAFAQAVREGQEVSWEETRGLPGAEPKRMLLRFRPVFAPDGTFQFMISSGIDITELKRTEDKLARQQEFYESILNLLPVDVAVFDAEHRFLFANPSSISDPVVRRQVMGLSNAEYFALRGQQQPAGMAQQREDYFDLAVRTRSDVSWEEMRTDRSQHPQLMMRHLRPVFGTDGALRLVVGSGIDITARYTAEKLQHEVQLMLELQQKFIRQILDALPNVLYMVDADGTVSFANNAYDKMVKHSQHWLTEGANPAVQEEMRQMQLFNQQVRTTYRAITREMPFTTTSGETLYFQVHKRPLQQANGQIGVLTVSTDITHVKRARQELERREKQYHDLVYYSQALICTHDLHGIVLSVNPAIEQLMGLPAAQLVGRHLGEAMPPENHAALQAYLDGSQP